MLLEASTSEGTPAKEVPHCQAAARAGEGWGAGSRRNHQLRPGALHLRGAAVGEPRLAQRTALWTLISCSGASKRLFASPTGPRGAMFSAGKAHPPSPRLVLAVSEVGICSVNMQRQQIANNNMHHQRRQLSTANAHRCAPAAAVMRCSSQHPAPLLCANAKQLRFAGAEETQIQLHMSSSTTQVRVLG
jgi:hypothetical protein